MCGFCMERLALMVAEVEAKDGHYILPDDTSLFEVAVVLQETMHLVAVLEQIQDPALLEDPDVATIIRCRFLIEHTRGNPASWVGHTLVKKVLVKKPSVPEAMTTVLDAVSRGENDFLKEVITMQVTMPDFLGWDLWAQRVAVRHLARERGAEAFLPYDPHVRPALMFYTGIDLGQQERNRVAESMMESIGLLGADGGEIKEYAEMLRG